MTTMQEYKIHYNGTRPFKVIILGSNINSIVQIYRKIEDSKDFEEKPFIEYKPIKIFVGLSPFDNFTSFGGGHGPNFDGNSILLQLTNDEYLFIGWEIYTFKSNADIVQYFSPVGNNDVPYPYAIDVNGDYYLLIENIILSNLPNQIDNPYTHFYKINTITDMVYKSSGSITISNNFQNITNFYINDNEYMLKFVLNAASNYDRLTSPKFDEDHNGDGKLFVEKTDGITYELSRDEYIQLMDDYAKHLNVAKISDKKIVHERL